MLNFLAEGKNKLTFLNNVSQDIFTVVFVPSKFR